jgi:hypothetical protein
MSKFNSIIQSYARLQEQDTKGDPFRIIGWNVAYARLRQVVSELSDQDRDSFITTHGKLAREALTAATARLTAREW